MLHRDDSVRPGFNPYRLGSKLSADIASVALLIAFVLLVYLFEQIVDPQWSQQRLIVAGIVMSIVPAILWMGFFYRRDSLEPEPKAMIVGVFALGALLAGAIALPLMYVFFDIQGWLYRDLRTYIVGSILVVGFMQEFLKYAAVRFSVFNSAEFNEYVDGIIYSTAAGLGFATALNIYFVVVSEGASLGLACIQIVLTAIAHAAFAGIVGYFLSRERFSERPVWWMPVGVALAAIFNGVFFSLRGEISINGFTAAGTRNYNWLGLLLAALLSLCITLFLTQMIRRDIRCGILPEVDA